MRDFKGALTGEHDEAHESLNPQGPAVDRTVDAEPGKSADSPH